MEDHESKLWYEVRAIMDEADEEERVLSSDDDGYAERVLGGNSAPSGVCARRVAPPPAASAARSSGEPVAAPTRQFRARLSAVFAGLEGRPAAPRGALAEDIGPVFSRQAAGFGLSEAAQGMAEGERVPRVFGGLDWGSAETSASAAHAEGQGASGAAEEGEESDEDGEEEARWDPGDPEDFGGGAEDGAKAVDDSAEWSSKTASWATKHGGSEEESSDEEEGGGAMEGEARRPAAGRGGACVAAGRSSEGVFGGVADLDELDDAAEEAEEMEGVELGGVEMETGASSLGGGMRGPHPPDPSRAGKRVRFDEEPAGPHDEALGANGVLAAGLLGRKQSVAPEEAEPARRIAAKAEGAPAGVQYVHYSLDSVASSDATNQEALAQLLALTGQGGAPPPPAGRADASRMPEYVVGMAPRRPTPRPMAPPPVPVPLCGTVRLSHLGESEDESASSGALSAAPPASTLGFRPSGMNERSRRNFRSKSSADETDSMVDG